MVSTSTLCPATLTYLVRTVGNTNPTLEGTQESNRSEARALVTSPQQRKHNDQTQHTRVHTQQTHSPRERTHLPLVQESTQHRSRPPNRIRPRWVRRPRQPRRVMQKMQRNTRKQLSKQQTCSTTTRKIRTPPTRPTNEKTTESTKKRHGFFKKSNEIDPDPFF